MGLYGEVGGVLAASKKTKREGKAYYKYKQDMIEEFGDVLWYFVVLCRRLALRVEDLISGSEEFGISSQDSAALEDMLLAWGKVTGSLMGIRRSDNEVQAMLREFFMLYLISIRAAEVSIGEVMEFNSKKVRERFLDPDPEALPTFDEKFQEHEQLPKNFEIHITERRAGQSYLRWNDVFIGDPLTDNMAESDDYRFHDVFHMAYAAILHWSPTFRKLIKQKRKSDSDIDENEDGGRAIVVEEGLTAWIFSEAKSLDYFEGQSTLPFGLLKTVQQFVRGYEVQICPLKLWERAILDGYSVFREVKKNKGGIVVGDRRLRTIKYKPLPE